MSTAIFKYLDEFINQDEIFGVAISDKAGNVCHGITVFAFNSLAEALVFFADNNFLGDSSYTVTIIDNRNPEIVAKIAGRTE
jgi:hypothetical protein